MDCVDHGITESDTTEQLSHFTLLLKPSLLSFEEKLP